MADEKPKIFVDEGWKAAVEREKAAAVAVPEPVAEPQDEEPFTHFDHLVSSLAAETMMALGLMVQEGQTEVTVDLDFAKHSIDTLLMLRDKTQGNLTPEEQANLGKALVELQRIFSVRVQQALDAHRRGGAGLDQAGPGGITLA